MHFRKFPDIDRKERALVEKSAAPASPPQIEYVVPDVAGLAAQCAAVALRWGDDGSKPDPLNLWRDPAAHPLTLLLLLLERYPESGDWAPEVIRVTAERDGLGLSAMNWNKLLAARVLIASPSPWRQWEVFHWVARGLSGLPSSFTYLEKPELGHLMVAADCMRAVDPSRSTAAEVDKFVAATLRDDGQLIAPPPLDFADRELRDPQLSCSNCGALHRDDNDTHCISCGKPALHPVPDLFEALRKQCRALYVEGLKSSDYTPPLDQAGNLVHALLLAHDQGEAVRRSLLPQLRAIAK